MIRSRQFGCAFQPVPGHRSPQTVQDLLRKSIRELPRADVKEVVQSVAILWTRRPKEIRPDNGVDFCRPIPFDAYLREGGLEEMRVVCACVDYGGVMLPRSGMSEDGGFYDGAYPYASSVEGCRESIIMRCSLFDATITLGINIREDDDLRVCRRALADACGHLEARLRAYEPHYLENLQAINSIIRPRNCPKH